MANFYYENQYSKDDDDEGKKKKKSILDNTNSPKEGKGRADDILSMIRSRNNPNIDYQLPDPPKKVESKKLREILNKISEEDPEVPDYWDTPIYKMGYDEGFIDGEKDGWNQATKHYYETLDAIKVLIKREQQ